VGAATTTSCVGTALLLTAGGKAEGEVEAEALALAEAVVASTEGTIAPGVCSAPATARPAAELRLRSLTTSYAAKETAVASAKKPTALRA